MDQRYSNDHVEFELPIDWYTAQSATDDAPAIFRSPDDSQRLTVSYQFYDPDIALNDIARLFDEYFKVRIRAEKSFLSDSDELKVGDTGSNETAIWRYFVGTERAKNRRFDGLVVAENGKLITLYIESIEQAAESHNELVSAVFSSVEVK